MPKKQITPDAPTDEKREKIEQWFLESYFQTAEIEEARRSEDAAEYLRRRAVNSRRSGGCSGRFPEFSHYETLAGGKLAVWLEPHKFANEPSAILSLRTLTRKLAESFAATKIPAPSIKTPTAPIGDHPQVVAVEIVKIVPSRFEPQVRRRARFKPEEIESLGESIITLGMFQPIVVRPKFPDFEIVFGERRFLASKFKRLKTIDCFIRDLSDAEVLELQYEENHRRQENSPLDDAFLFKFLMESSGYSEEQLADRLNTSRRNVVEKLKLNDLISEAVGELETGSLPLKHAYYLAKFPGDTQREIVREKFAYKYNDREEKAVSFDEFKAEVEEAVVRRLSAPPFDPHDPRLHIKGLTCDVCPERTGFETQLFPDLAHDDSCLNSVCFRLKTDTHLKLKREEIAAQMPNPTAAPVQDIARAVPLVTTQSYAPERSPFGKEKVLTSVQALPEPECEFSELGLAVGGERKGEQVYICRNDDCEIHNPKPPEPSQDEIERRERHLNSEIDKSVRRQILKAASDWLDDYKPFWQFDDLIKDLIFVFLQITKFTHEKDFLFFIQDWKDAPKDYTDKARLRRFVDGLDKRRQSQILFLMSQFSEMPSSRQGNNDETRIRAIAEDYAEIHYDRLAEETRESMKI